METPSDVFSPHAIRFSINTNGEVPDLTPWGVKYPTKAAAEAIVEDLNRMRKNLRGEPEQAWSDIAKLTRCPFPALLPRFKNINAEIVPVSEDLHEQHRKLRTAPRVLNADLTVGANPGQAAAGPNVRGPQHNSGEPEKKSSDVSEGRSRAKGQAPTENENHKTQGTPRPGGPRKSRP